MGIAYFNGNWVADDQPQLPLHEKAEIWGAGIFETIALVHHSAPLLSYHFERFSKSCQKLNIRFDQNIKHWQLLLLEIAEKNQTDSGKIRIQISIDDNFSITLQPFDTNPFHGMEVEAVIFPEPLLLYTQLSGMKSTSRLPYVFAQQYAYQHQAQTALLLNNKNEVTESCNGNVFIVEGNTIVTPPLTSGCVDGIFRKLLLEKCTEFDFKEESINPQRLLLADEVFLTNAIKGIHAVATIDHKSLFDKKITTEIKHAANRMLE